MRWDWCARAVVIYFKHSVVEGHKSLGLGESYYSPLWRVYAKILRAEPNLNINMALRIAQKAVNYTMDPFCLFPTLLVYGMIPLLPFVDSDFPDQHSRISYLKIARREYASVVVVIRIQQTLRAQTPAT